jgi:thioredoxin 1
MPILITKENFDQEITKSSKPVVLDVFATWCGPCQYMMPIFDELEKEHGATYTFAKLNVDESRDIAVQYGVTSIPTFIFIKNNVVQAKEMGYMKKEDLLKKIQLALGK